MPLLKFINVRPTQSISSTPLEPAPASPAAFHAMMHDIPTVIGMHMRWNRAISGAAHRPRSWYRCLFLPLLLLLLLLLAGSQAPLSVLQADFSRRYITACTWEGGGGVTVQLAESDLGHDAGPYRT